MNANRLMSCSLGLVLALASYPVHAALLAYYPFDDGAGSVADEVTGLSNDATLGNAPAWTTGQIGSALDFNGTNQYALVPSFTKATNSMSMSAWVNNPNAAANGVGSIVKNWGNSSATGHFHFGLDGSGKLRFFSHDSGGVKGPVVSSSTLTAGWHQVGFVADAATGEFRLYLDGALAGSSASFTGTLLANPMAAMAIGAKTNDNGTTINGEYFKGQIDDLGLFDVALPNAQMNAVYRLALQDAVDTYNLSGKYNLGNTNQLLLAYAANGSTTIGTDSWVFASGLGGIKGSAQPGELFLSGGQTYLLLDGNANTGMQLATNPIPEPTSAFLIIIGSIGLCSLRRCNRRN